jgi:spore coat polysaccharide biosynthesis protein SpsF (cytidylyltransferase family)
LCKRIDEVVVATTTESKDDPIALWCKQNGVLCYRGSEDDVLDRVAGACRYTNADVIVQMGADSAYLDFELIDGLIEVYKSGDYDYVCNDLELTYPLGIYGHIVRVSKLIELNMKRDLSIEDREDVVRYIWEHPDEYKICHIKAPPDKNFPNLRLTIDYPEDFELATTLFERFGRTSITTREIIALYKTNPGIFDKVSNLVQRSAPFLKSTHE